MHLNPRSLLLSSCVYTCSYSPQFYFYALLCEGLSVFIFPLSHLHSTAMYCPSAHTPHHMTLRPYPYGILKNLGCQHQPIHLLFLQLISWSSHLLSNLSFFSQYVFFSLLFLFSLNLYLVPLVYVETSLRLSSCFVKAVGVLFFLTQG